MKWFLKLLLLFSMTTTTIAQTDFKAHQLTFERVRTAYKEKWPVLKTELETAGIKEAFNLYIVAYKYESRLEIWVKDRNKKQYQLFKAYSFCANSGTLGPKIKEGDLQTPEGFYHVNAFNPKSNFYLSLGVNYPNGIDRLRSGKEKPGGDIYIHGNCVTVGCIPLTDEKIKEVYVLAVEARNAGQQQIPVHIFPFKMNTANLNKQLPRFPQQKNLWETLRVGYDYFQKNKLIPTVTELNGKYIIK
ncbi:murein L,D-transpeptidase family protein [Pedobacter frigoris]|uniref:L,D-transpeptidase family protein n=1 Tax=Pedobacter frigoris TaxID=2571272 RepID=UPI0029309C3A|nr:L,D-transpeptidase family protein [Pedobacter frigoris]